MNFEALILDEAKLVYKSGNTPADDYFPNQELGTPGGPEGPINTPYKWEEDDRAEIPGYEDILTPILKNIPIGGKNALTTKMRKDRHIFYGYSVKDVHKAEIYHSLKGHANNKDGQPFHRYFWPIDPKVYDLVSQTAIDTFLQTVTAPYDVIGAAESRSTHVRDLMGRIDAGLKAKFTSGIYATRANECQIKTMIKFRPSSSNVEKIFDVDRIVKGISTTFRNTNGQDFTEQQAAFLDYAVRNDLRIWGYNFNREEQFSEATHLKLVPMNAILRNVRTEMVARFPELQEMHFAIHGHGTDFCRSTLDPEINGDLRALIQLAKVKYPKPRFLIVDDNINSGCLFKQIADVDPELKKYAEFFILLKNEKF